jgi:hypothetical protein
MDYVVFGLFIGLLLVLIIGSWFTSNHPVFAFFYFIAIILMVVVSTFFVNVWEDVTQSSVFGNTINSFPKTNNLIMTMPFWLAGVGLLGLVVMFGKPAIIGGGT